MKKRTVKATAIASSSLLLLTGCYGNFGWPMIANENCGDIALLNEVDQNPPLYYSYDPEVDDLPYFHSNIEWTVNNLPPYYSIDPQGEEVPEDFGNVYGYGFQTMPLNWLAVADSEYRGVESDFALQSDETFVYGLQAEQPDYLPLGAENDTYIYQRTTTLDDLPGFFGDFIYGENQLAMLPFLYSFYHLPTTLITKCGDPIVANDFYTLDNDPNSDRQLVTLGRTSSREVYPGYVPNLIDFESQPTSVTFASTAGDERVPITASVVPWFSGYFDVVFGEDRPEINFDELTQFEQFWLSQLMYMQVSGQFGNQEMLDLYAYFNDAVMESGNPFEEPVIAKTLQRPLTEETYEDLIFESTQGFVNGSLDALPEDEFKAKLGNLEYLFIYVFYAEQIDPNNGDDLEISYSFDRYYPGAQGNIITQQEFILEQAAIPPAFLYSGPILSSAVPSRAKSGEIVTLSGNNLGKITELSIDSTKLEIVERSSSQLRVRVPQGMKPGLKDVLVKSDTGQLTSQGLFTVSATPSTTIKALGKTKVLVEVKNPVGLGRVQIKLNGKQVAEFNATHENDKALKNGRFNSQLKLLKGRRNSIEIYVNGEIVRSVSYRR